MRKFVISSGKDIKRHSGSKIAHAAGITYRHSKLHRVVVALCFHLQFVKVPQLVLLNAFRAAATEGGTLM